MSLIPGPGVHIFENPHPRGWYVALYDAEGFTSRNSWFPTLAQAQAYAGILKAMVRLNAQMGGRNEAAR